MHSPQESSVGTHHVAVGDLLAPEGLIGPEPVVSSGVTSSWEKRGIVDEAQGPEEKETRWLVWNVSSWGSSRMPISRTGSGPARQGVSFSQTAGPEVRISIPALSLRWTPAPSPLGGAEARRRRWRQRELRGRRRGLSNRRYGLRKGRASRGAHSLWDLLSPDGTDSGPPYHAR